MDLAIALDSNAAVPLHRQLYEELRPAILSGRLLTRQRTSTRTLAVFGDFSHHGDPKL